MGGRTEEGGGGGGGVEFGSGTKSLSLFWVDAHERMYDR